MIRKIFRPLFFAEFKLKFFSQIKQKSFVNIYFHVTNSFLSDQIILLKHNFEVRRADWYSFYLQIIWWHILFSLIEPIDFISFHSDLNMCFYETKPKWLFKINKLHGYNKKLRLNCEIKKYIFNLFNHNFLYWCINRK